MNEDTYPENVEAINRQVNEWFDAYAASPRYESLTEFQKAKAHWMVQLFGEFSNSYLGLAPEHWSQGGLREWCLEIAPRKVTAEREFFESIAPVLSSFFTFLAESGRLSNGRELAKTVTKLDKDIVAYSQDPREWGMAKSLAMAATEAGVDFHDKQAVDEFIAEYNKKILARLPPEPPAPVFSEPLLPALTTPVRRAEPKTGRNDPCPCGSGKKYKKCCGQ